MAYAAALEAVFCGFESRSPYRFLVPMPTCHRASMPPLDFQALSSAGESGLFIRARSRVRIPQGRPFYHDMNNPSDPNDAPASEPPAGDHAWLRSLLPAKGCNFIDGLTVEATEAPGYRRR